MAYKQYGNLHKLHVSKYDQEHKAIFNKNFLSVRIG